MEDFLLFESDYSQDELIIRDSVSRYVTERVTPKMLDAFEKGEFPREFIQDVAKLGLLGMRLPTQYGGSGASALSYGLVCQELEKGDSGLRSFVSVQSSLCMYPIFQFGSEEQKLAFLPLMAKGEIIGCFGLTEPNSGSDPSSMLTHAKKVQGGWQLSGSKTWITNAPIADLAIVFAKTDEGIRGFLVEAKTPGFQRTEIKHKLSLRASVTGSLHFDDCFIPDDHLLPGTTVGLKAALSCLTQARFGIAWGVMGAAMACYERAKTYTLDRQQFQRPLASFQLVQQDLVNMLSEIVKAQAVNIQLAKLKQQQLATPEMVSLAKRNACREALKIARSARNLLGGNGISLEYDVIRHMNNLEAVFTYEGTDNIHTLIIGRHITGISAFS